MSERPFMQLYVSDFLGDTQDLSAEYVGSYLLLLMTMWNADGSLAFDEVKLARVARLTVEEWRLAWTDLGRFFTVEEGRLTHQRLTFELRKFARKSSARSEAGRKGGTAKALKNKNAGLAIAVANGVASSRNHIKKGDAVASDPTDGFVKVDKHIHGDDLFAACVALHTTEKIPKFMDHWSFPRAIVSQARASLETAETKH
jgi:uncharacterized protein YdaU (DUF1376 family)